MEFKKEFLRAVIYGDGNEAKIVEDNIIDSTRWSIVHRVVFVLDGKYYQTKYSRGATEYQDERPFEYDGDLIEVTEVVPVQKLITVYEKPKPTPPDPLKTWLASPSLEVSSELIDAVLNM